MKIWGKRRSEEEAKRRQGKNAVVFRNNRLVSISAQSGLGMLGFDLQGAHFLLPPNAADEVLGNALLGALSNSRRISPQEDPSFSNQGIMAANKIWQQSLMDQFEYKTRKQLYENMISCDVRLFDNFITMTPLRHEGLEGWGGMKDPTLNVVISGEAPPSEIGAALRLTLDRCIP